MQVEHFLGRLGALVLGLIGVMIGFVVNIIGSTIGHVNDVATHGGRGLLLLLVGLVGSLLAPFTPIVAAVLLAVAAIGFFFVVGLGAIFPAVFFLLAAVLAYIDRRTTYHPPVRQ